MPRAIINFGLLCAVALGVAGCSNNPLFDRESYSGMFSKKVDLFATPAWATSSKAGNAPLGPTGPVAPENLVAADGTCAPAAEASPAPAPQPAPAQQTAAAPAPLPDRLEPGLPAVGPAIVGGVALGMSECEVVRRIGTPSNVSIGAGAKGERKAVLSYLKGNWPGIYEFNAGRLKVIDAVPEASKSASKKKAGKTSNSSRGVRRVYVQ